MATITTDLVIDEQIGVQTVTDDNDVDLTLALITKLQGLGVQISATDATTGFPQVANDPALLDTTDVDDLALSIPDDGTPSLLSTVDGVAIFLYDENGIIYGREGTFDGTTYVANPSGDLAFAVALDLSGGVSSAQVYLIQYQALQHGVTDAIDDDDILSFAANTITLNVTTTEFVTTFESLDFAAIPPGGPRELLKVDTSDPTDNHSAVFDGLIFPDGPVSDPTLNTYNPGTNGTNDDLNPDAIGFGVKGGQASQLNQNEGFFVQDAAWTSSDPDDGLNEIGGIKFDIQGIGGVKSVDIEWWAVDNGEVIKTGTDHVTLPKGNAVYEDYTIQSPTDDPWSDPSVDQIYVRFTYDTNADNAGVRVENLQVAFPSTAEVPVVTPEDLGTHLVFEDAGPKLEDVDDALVGFTAGASAGDADLGLGYDSDGPESLKITDHDEIPSSITDILGPITSELSPDGTLLTYSSVDFGDLFTLALDADEPGAYTFTVLQAPLVTNTLDFGGVDPGGPVEDIDITAPGGTAVNFDGFLITDFGENLKGQFAAGDLETPDPDAALEDVNVSTQGIGLKDNQMDPSEALKLTLDPGVQGIVVKFDGATGPGKTFGIKIEAYDANGDLVFSDSTTETAPKGSNELDKTYVFPEEAVEVYIGLDLATNSGVRIAEVAVIENVEVPDFELGYTVTAVDGDTDSTPADFTVQIDGNNDGTINI
jgi:Domain of unknown function (DUF5801)